MPLSASLAHLTPARLMLARAVPAAGRSTTGCRRTSVAHRDLGHLEGDVAAWPMTFAPILISLRADWSATRLRRLGHRHRPHEVADVISQCMELEADGIGGECSARVASV